jgi:hypothetical protein
MSFVNQRFLFLDTRSGRWFVYPEGWRIRAAVAIEDYYCFAPFLKRLSILYVMFYLVKKQEIYALASANRYRGSRNVHLTALQTAVLSSEIFFSSLTLSYTVGVALLNRHSFIAVGRKTLLRFNFKNFGDPKFVELPRTQINFAFAGSWRQVQRPVSTTQLLVSR